MPLRGAFTLATAADLRAKLRRDFKKLRAKPAGVDEAFNFFVTAESLREWHYPGRPNKKRREAIRAGVVVLQITEHIAVGAKHLVPEAQHHNTVKGASRKRTGGVFGAGAFGARTFGAGAFGGVPVLMVELDGEAAKKFGPRIVAVDLATKVLAYWDVQDL